MFARELFIFQELTNPLISQRAINLIIVIFSVFLFSLLIIYHAKGNNNKLLGFFALVYATGSALFFILSAYYTFVGIFNSWQQIAYSLLTAVIVAMFAFIVTLKSNVGFQGVTIPFIIASIIHIVGTLIIMWEYATINPFTHIYLITEVILIGFLLAQDTSNSNNLLFINQTDSMATEIINFINDFIRTPTIVMFLWVILFGICLYMTTVVIPIPWLGIGLFIVIFLIFQSIPRR